MEREMGGENDGKQVGGVGVEDGPTTPSLKVPGTEKRGRGRPRKTAEGEKYQRKPQVYRSEVFRLTETDLEVFEWLAMHRWSTREMLVEQFYSRPKRLNAGLKPSGAYGAQRLTKLVRSGYIEPSKFRIGPMVPLLLSKTGYGVLHGMGRVEWAHYLGEIDPSTIEHERLCQVLRIRLQSLGVTGWQTERRLKWESHVKGPKGLEFVSDAQFEAGGYRWCLEVERTLKSKDKRIKAFDVRAKMSKSMRYLYVVPKAILENLRESMKSNSFELGLYIWDEDAFREGQNTVKSSFPFEKADLHLHDLLRGGFEAPIASRRLREAVMAGEAELATMVRDFSADVVSLIDRRSKTMTAYVEAVAKQQKEGWLALGKKAVERPQFDSQTVKELRQRFAAVTRRRRELRAKLNNTELDASKKLEVAFDEYASQLEAFDAGKADPVRGADAFLVKAHELRGLLIVLNNRKIP